MNDKTINSDLTLGGSEGTLLANRYRIVRQLGQGGMGSVWLAADTQLDNREVAIKMLPSILVSNKRAYNQLKSEALVSLKLTHPNIAAVRAFEENGGNPFLVVDYIDGQTLDDCLADKGKLSEDETIRLLEPIASALDYAHGEGVVHRDVKPGNVMIRKDGHPFILDFGIAREIQETMTRVTGKLSSGTLMYMSPEQLHGAAPKSSQDVYSFAAMAYECLMGTPPFSRGQIEYQIEHDSPAPIDPQFAKCGSGIMAGLAKSPDDRPANCANVLSAGGGHGVTALPVGHGADGIDEDGRARAPRKPRHWGAVTALSTLAILAIGGFVYLLERHPGDAVGTMHPQGVAIASDETKHKPGDMKIVALPGGAKLELVWCAPGSFMMGSPTWEGGRGADETPHRVTLTKGFWIGKYEVTQRQWESVMGSNPSFFKGENRPVETVSWEDCQEFCRKAGLGLRLPTEAEWEYACRAGTTTPFSFGSVLNGDRANCDGKHDPYGTTAKGRFREETSVVGEYGPNAWGLYDMEGNVGEWCSDWYGSYGGDGPDPTGPTSAVGRVYRGGCWSSIAMGCRSATRSKFVPGSRYAFLGFRVCCSAGVI